MLELCESIVVKTSKCSQRTVQACQLQRFYGANLLTLKPGRKLFIAYGDCHVLCFPNLSFRKMSHVNVAIKHQAVENNEVHRVNANWKHC